MSDTNEPSGEGAPAVDEVINRFMEEEYYRTLTQAIVAQAGAVGIVVTVEQRPLLPLTMGHFETVVDVRRASVPA
jgi:hypothetical protein